MPDENTSELRLWLAEERPTALKLASGPKVEPGQALSIWWVPRTHVEYLRKSPPASPGEYPPVVLTLPDWKIEEQKLWKYVSN
jgi:hypothetical protein